MSHSVPCECTARVKLSSCDDERAASQAAPRQRPRRGRRQGCLQRVHPGRPRHQEPVETGRNRPGCSRDVTPAAFEAPPSRGEHLIINQETGSSDAISAPKAGNGFSTIVTHDRPVREAHQASGTPTALYDRGNRLPAVPPLPA